MSDASHVVRFIGSPDCSVEATVTSDTVLIESGLLDSLALFQLTLWIEQEVGRPLDLAAFDISKEWNTPADIARFIARHRPRSP